MKWQLPYFGKMLETVYFQHQETQILTLIYQQ